MAFPVANHNAAFGVTTVKRLALEVTVPDEGLPDERLPDERRLMRRHRCHRALIGMGLLILVVGSCGGDADREPPALETTTAATSAITIEDFDFGEPLTVAVGGPVVVTNVDVAPHTWTADDGTFDSGSLAQDESFTFTFDTAGEYTFFCSIHPAMTGRITVTE